MITGSAYVFYSADGLSNWSETAKLVASDAAAGDLLGYSVTVSDNVVVVGAYSDDSSTAGSGAGTKTDIL
jgi:hypothetical protein